jgi:hypothetical protein
MKRDGSRRAKLERLLREAIKEAEELAEPDVAEIVRDALDELEHPRDDLEDHANRPLHDSETAAGESFSDG